MPGNWRKEQIQASGLGQTKKCPWWNALQEGHLSPSKDFSPASASFPCFFRRFARLFMDPSVSGWFAPRCASLPARARRCRASAWRLGMAPVVWGPRPGSACEYHVEREERWATALSLDWWKRCQVQLYHVNAHIIQNLKNQTQSSTSWHFNIIWMCVIVVPIFRLQINCNLRVHLFCDFFAKTLWQPQTSQTETCNAASVLCKHLLLNFDMSMFWHVHTWRDLRWFEMICVKLTCSCIIALLHRWQSLRWSENVVVVFRHFSQLGPTQNAAPSTRHGVCPQHGTSAAPRWTSPAAAAPTPSCSPRWASSGARGPAAAPWPPGIVAAAARPRRRRRAPPAPGRASAVERHGSRKVPTAPWRREGTFLTICGVVAYFWIQVLGEKPRFWDSICFVAIWCLLYKYCCLLQSTAFTLRLCGISGCESVVTRQYSSWLNHTCLLMCWSLWRDWDPHRLSAKSASWCSGPNLSTVASARHRSLGPWWCLSHGCAYHMAMRWSTMSPTWKTNQFQENGQVREMVKVWENFKLQSEAPWLLGCNRWPLLQMRDLQPDVFTREGGGGKFFLNWQTCVLNAAGRFKSTHHSIVNRHI